MKKLLLITAFLSCILYANAQSPQGINYQAVARTSTGAIIPAQSVNVRFTLLEGNINGNVLYQETHQTTTNNYGLFTLAIGKGNPVAGTFPTINWSTGTEKFLKVEIAADGTNTYQLSGTSQLLSVPYALYAEKTKLTAGNAISITNGNTIAANYAGGTGININGNIISHALQSGTGIAINGSTISHNFQAGNGISISGNVISATSGNNSWISDASGIHNQSGNVGIGTNSHPIYPLYVRKPNHGDGQYIALFESDDTWHSAIMLKNTTVNQMYSFMVGGSGNLDIKPQNMGLYNSHLVRWSMIVDHETNNIGFGSPNIRTSLPKSTVHVFTGDVNIEQIGSGIILKSPNGQCWRVTIDNNGNLIRTAIACP